MPIDHSDSLQLKRWSTPTISSGREQIERHDIASEGLNREPVTDFMSIMGALVDEEALAEALQTREIAGADLGVLSTEPPPSRHALIGTPRCVIAPHPAWATVAARSRLMHVTVENLRTFLAGTPVNQVSP